MRTVDTRTSDFLRLRFALELSQGGAEAATATDADEEDAE